MEIAGYYINNTSLKKVEDYVGQGQDIFPPKARRFRALELTPLKNIKVVILGQDPYHGEGQANGLCFSVNKGVKLPPSLKNIYKELQSDLSIQTPEHGNLTSWAKQGVLMLNAVLSVEKSKPASHAGQGWEGITDAIISQINDECENVVFLLWGAYAQKKVSLIDENKHHVLSTTHPSPFSAHKGFLGSKCFSKANMFLKEQKQKTINWNIL